MLLVVKTLKFMRTTAQFLQVFFVMALAWLAIPNGFAQQKKPVADCGQTFESITEAADGGQANGKLYLTLKKGQGDFTLKVYDIYGGSREFAATKQVSAARPNDKILVSDRLPASTYVVQVISSDCRQMLGGLDGFTIGTK